MDFIGNGWLGYMTEIQTNCNTDTEQEIGINQYMAKLKRVLKKKANLHWHIEFLHKYVRENINPLGLRIQLYPSFQVTSPEFKLKWENILTQCSLELMKLLILHYQTELNTLDQEIFLLQTSNEIIREHTLFSKRVQETKDYITKITKDIIYKKQNKLSKDRLAFSEGFAYHWQNALQRKGSRNYHRVTKINNNYTVTDEDTESDSSFRSTSSAPRQNQHKPRDNSTARKRDYGGNSYTPSSKKRPSNADIRLSSHPYTQGHGSQPNGRSLSQPKYLGTTALQAIQLLSNQSQTLNMTQSNTSGPTEVGLTNVNPIDSKNHQGQNPPTTLLPLTQRAPNTRQSTLDAHIQTPQTQTNFHLLSDMTTPT